MTNPPSNTIQFDLKEIFVDIKQSFNKIDTKFDKLEAKIDKVAEDLSAIKTNLVRVELEIKGDLARIEASLKGEIKVLEEKVDGFGKRIDTQEFINRGVLIGLILAILGGFAKIFGLAKWAKTAIANSSRFFRILNNLT